MSDRIGTPRHPVPYLGTAEQLHEDLRLLTEVRANGKRREFRTVKADPRLRKAFVKRLRDDLQRLDELRREKMLLIAWLQKE